jgi:hypothetical protein
LRRYQNGWKAPTPELGPGNPVMMTVQHCPIINLPTLFEMRTEGLQIDVYLFDLDLYHRMTKWTPISPHDEAKRWWKRLVMLLVILIINYMWNMEVIWIECVILSTVMSVREGPFMEFLKEGSLPYWTFRISAKPCKCLSLCVKCGFSQTTQVEDFYSGYRCETDLPHIDCRVSRWRPGWLHQSSECP